MVYRTLRQSIEHLESAGQLRRINEEVDPRLEMAEIHRRVHSAGGPALYFAKVKGSPFPCVSNLFGTRARAEILIGDGIRRVQALLRLKSDPLAAAKRPLGSLAALWGSRTALPWSDSSPAVAARKTTLAQLPQIISWPDDGGAFITLPMVYTENPDRPGILGSNLGMYRVQISGGEYAPDHEAGLHYQIHRGIGVHHHAAIKRGEKLKVSIFVGGPPSHILAAIMPLPEGMPEILFAGVLGGRGFRYARQGGHLISADADFCITGTIDPSRTLPEGPFGDHMGYYSLRHPFPVLTVDNVFHRENAIWPFTVVGRPPQEDAVLAEIIHELAGDALPSEIPGLRAVHAVEAAGVHPLLLALADDRYLPYAESKPRELHTVAHAIFGYGQLSLAKYLWLAGREDNPPDIRDVPAFMGHILRRVAWEKDLHFITRTTMDTLDYSGSGFNEGSKTFVAVSGSPRRELAREIPEALLVVWPEEWSKPRLAMPGVLVFSGKAAQGGEASPAVLDKMLERISEKFQDESVQEVLKSLPLWVMADDTEFVCKSTDNFLWVTFTRSDPARDVHGISAFMENKHWGCRGPLVIDARLKPHHAPPLISDPEVVRRVEAMAAPGRSLHGLF